MDNSHGRSGNGLMALDYESKVLAARSFTKNILVELALVKGLAALYVVEFGREMSFIYTILERDALQICHSGKSKE